ncbi:AraC family transcriptional regulator [Paenibacillus sp. RC67]|uniref:AraC family transcriptional regulator n=1 Tax=Paenibacillus sp. RC67 TaxID=3039392 RepID=UPI0024AE7FD6|nr:AraC family transcriptional regulator [Paenibacillus sp. RC67]
MRINRELNLKANPFQFDYLKTEPKVDTFHSHEGMEFLFVYDGYGTAIVNGHLYDIKPGILLYFQPFQLHRIQFAKEEAPRYRRSVLTFEPAVMDTYLKSLPSLRSFLHSVWKEQLEAPYIDLTPIADHISGMLALFHQRLASLPSEHRVEEYAGFMIGFIQCIRPYWLKAYTVDLGTRQPRIPHHAELIMQWIEEHFQEEFRLEKLASDIHLSENHISSLFRRATGSTISQYLTARRIKEACHLLRSTDLPLQEISLRIGFSSTSYLCQLFKKQKQLSPFKFRELHAN